MRRTVGKNTSNSKEIVNGQQYKLLPNPNNGSFTLMQNIINNQTNRVEIWNSTGIKVYSNFIDFNSGISSVNFSNHIPGLYLLKITDNNGNSFTLKFVIE